MDETPDQIKTEKIHSILAGYRDFLKSSEYSNATIKNYLSDLRHLIVWIEERYSSFKFIHLDLSSLRSYRSFVKEKFRSKPSIAARRLSSLRKFLGWAGGQKYVPEYLVKASEDILLDNPSPKPSSPTQLGVQILTSGVSNLETVATNFFTPQKKSRPPMPDQGIKKLLYHIRYLRPAWYERYHSLGIHRPLHFAMLGLVLLLIANFMFGNMLDSFLKNQANPDYGSLLAATSPPKILSFQGRLTDENSVPITSTTDVDFKIYDAETSGTLLWTSKDWDVAPDANGIFSVCLGNTGTTDECLKEPGDSPDSYTADTAFSATLFSDNAALYLDLTVEGESLSPRQRIAASSFALNSDSLDGIDSTSFLRSDTSDSFTSGTLTTDGGTTLDVNGTLALGGATISEGIDMNTNILTNIGNTGTDFVASTGGLTLAGNLNINGTVPTGLATFNGSIDATTCLFGLSCWGLLSQANLTTNSMTNVMALWAQVVINASGKTLTNAFGVYVSNPVATAGTITNSIGIQIEDQTTGTGTNYGIYINGGNTAALHVNSDPVKFVQGAADTFTIDAETTDKTDTNNAVAINVDINSGNVAGLAVDIDVGTALSSGEIADGLKIDVSGHASDNSAAAVNGIRLIGATASGAPVTAIDIETTFDTDIDLQNDETIDNATDGVIHFSGALQGDVVSTATSDSGVTSTISTPALAYYVQSTDTASACSTGSKTFDITGPTSAEGSFIFIVSKATDGGCSSGTLTVTVAIDGGTIGTVANAASNNTITESYLASYINGAWRVVAVNSATAGGADTFDLAEWIPYTGDEPQPGELVTASTSQNETVERSSQVYDRKLLGIVSTNPHTTMGTPTDQSIRLALSGRVPTKVSTENGSISIGDPLTSSSIPGVAMKATRSGPIVGKALEAYSNPDPSAVGSVTVFLSVGWYYAENNTMVNQLKINLSQTSKFEWTDSLGNTVAWVNDLGEAFFTKVTGLVGDFQKLVFGELIAKKDSGSAGEASFEASSTEVFVESTKVKEDSLISITPVTKTNGLSIYIKEKRSGEGFVVALERNNGDLPGEATASANQAIRFNWFILNQE